MVKTFMKRSLLGAAVLGPCVLVTSSPSVELSPFLFTVSILILSTIFLATFTKKRKAVIVENKAPQNLLENEVEEKPEPEAVLQSEAAKEDEIGNNIQECLFESPHSTSDSESSGDSMTREIYELDWMHSDIVVGQNQEMPDDYSVSEDEEDGLIEIAIPGSESSDLCEETEQNLQSNPSSFLPESIFKQQELVELLAEMNEVNEEENLIEIDISAGSIKCPRFEIEA